jgi:hypothetical protein
MKNPFDAANDPDRHYIWDRLVVADSVAFVAGDFSMIENDFDLKNFEGIRCSESVNPDDWHVAFAKLEQYRERWLEASQQHRGESAETIMSRCTLEQIEINGDRALAHKKFPHAKRQTIYRLHRIGGVWKIVGFLGFLSLV